LWDQLERDSERASRNSLLQKAAALLLDGWAKMNVHFAKVPFADQTLDDALEYLCRSAGIPILDMSVHMFENDVNCFRPKLQNGIYGPLLGKQSAQLAKVKVAILRREGELGMSFPAVGSKLAVLEYQTIVHDIFNEVLMNRHLHIMCDNVGGFKMHLR
jgi:hypothetical protein